MGWPTIVRPVFALLVAWTGLADRLASSDAGKAVEVVLAHYEEDLSWIKAYEGSGATFTVYSKSQNPPEIATALPNVGRESQTYLHHIVNNYDDLADWTVFSQAVAPTWGYHG